MAIQTEFFTETKKELFLQLKQLTLSLNEIFKQPAELWNSSLSIQGSTTKDYLDSIYTINQSIISTIKEVSSDIYEGKINNSRLYFESDLRVVEVLLDIYIQFSAKEKNVNISDIMYLKASVEQQISTLYKMIELFPEDLATNVKVKPKVISKVALDYYQLIHLAVTHSQSQVNNITLVQNVIKLSVKTKVIPSQN